LTTLHEGSLSTVIWKTPHEHHLYSEAEQYGTGHDEYNSPGDCVLTLLQAQSDHERQLAKISSGVTRDDIDDDYHEPVII